MANNIILVILADIICFFLGNFTAGFLAGFVAVFLGRSLLIPLTALLTIPVGVSFGHLAGRWIVRRKPALTPTEIVVGCVVGTSVLTVLAGLAHPIVGALSLGISFATSFALYRSALHKDFGAAVMAKKLRVVLSGFKTSAPAPK